MNLRRSRHYGHRAWLYTHTIGVTSTKMLNSLPLPPFPSLVTLFHFSLFSFSFFSSYIPLQRARESGGTGGFVGRSYQHQLLLSLVLFAVSLIPSVSATPLRSAVPFPSLSFSCIAGCCPLSMHALYGWRVTSCPSVKNDEM